MAGVIATICACGCSLPCHEADIPLCVGCNEVHTSNDNGICRDCDIDTLQYAYECRTCGKVRSRSTYGAPLVALEAIYGADRVCMCATVGSKG